MASSYARTARDKVIGEKHPDRLKRKNRTVRIAQGHADHGALILKRRFLGISPIRNDIGVEPMGAIPRQETGDMLSCVWIRS
jgi:hypothetical protein